MIGLSHYLIVGLILFLTGLYGVLTRRSAIGILLSIELMFNAVNLNLVTFSYFLGSLTGQVFALFVIAIAAAESCVGIALVLCVYRNFKESDITRINLLKW
jgi:NADH:ubiquinone oxidoreductase subunit K